MQGVGSSDVTVPETGSAWLRSRAVTHYSGIAKTASVLLSAFLLVLSFPDFDLYPLAWVGLIPLLIPLVRQPNSRSAFILGWLWGVLFFYGTCYWLTYSMIHYGHINPWISYALLLIPVALVALFPALFCMVLARLLARWGAGALLAAPFLWVSLEWTRLEVTGQLWNAIGYSQAYAPGLIQSARWGGVYAVGFLIVLANATLAYALAEKTKRALILGIMILFATVAVIVSAIPPQAQSSQGLPVPNLFVVAVQPNVPMERLSTETETESLIARHILLSRSGLQDLGRKARVDNGPTKDNAIAGWDTTPRLVIWPESPMNFTYGRDSRLRDQVATFVEENHTSLLLNSLESAPEGGDYNSALMVNEQGRLVAQYDKIRLMPFGEYVPLPRWLPGSNAIAPMVGGFSAGTRYALMPLATMRAGVFICFESAFPSIARRFTNEGAGVLINISNDGYLGPTPVMRQHLANAIFRAVENNRPVLRVTNTGLTAYITHRGEVRDLSGGFQPEVRTWAVNDVSGRTFYTHHGDLFIVLCGLISLLTLGASVVTQIVDRRRFF
jgi:apolipoprotein N-acyltransferase